MLSLSSVLSDIIITKGNSGGISLGGNVTGSGYDDDVQQEVSMVTTTLEQDCLYQ